jgi:hypothetical protein
MFNWFGAPEPADAAAKAAPAPKPYAHLHEPEAFMWTAPKTWKAMQAMRQFSPLGRRLLDWAQAEQMGFTEAKDQIDPNLGGQQWGNNVAINPENAEGFNITVLAHEIMHAVQRKAGRIEHRKSWDLRGRILSVLFREAASEVCAAVVHYECAQNGYEDPDPDAWEAQRTVYDTYRGVYDDEIEEGADAQAAHDVAATEAHMAYMVSRSLTQYYINKEIVGYMRDIADGSLKKHVPISTLGSNFGGNLTKFEDVALVKHPVMPVTDGELLYGDPLLIHIADYLELLRIQDSDVSGPTSFVTQRLLRTCMAKGNPFLGVDMNKALAEYDRRKDGGEARPNIILIMCELAGLKVAPQAQLSFDFPGRFSGPAP